MDKAQCFIIPHTFIGLIKRALSYCTPLYTTSLLRAFPSAMPPDLVTSTDWLFLIRRLRWTHTALDTLLVQMLAYAKASKFEFVDVRFCEVLLKDVQTVHCQGESLLYLPKLNPRTSSSINHSGKFLTTLAIKNSVLQRSFLTICRNCFISL